MIIRKLSDRVTLLSAQVERTNSILRNRNFPCFFTSSSTSHLELLERLDLEVLKVSDNGITEHDNHMQRLELTVAATVTTEDAVS